MFFLYLLLNPGIILLDSGKKGGNAWCFHLILLYLQQVFEEMLYSQGLHGTDKTTKRTEK
jgi:hypothetical protein